MKFCCKTLTFPHVLSHTCGPLNLVKKGRQGLLDSPTSEIKKQPLYPIVTQTFETRHLVRSTLLPVPSTTVPEKVSEL